jgi:uroporphyrinogen III methyltransferase/synthase
MQASLKPLTGMRVLITRPENDAASLSNKLRALGASTLELATIAIVPPEKTDDLDRAVRGITGYDWIVFTSANGVRFFHERAKMLNVSFDKLNQVKVAAIGPATADALEGYGRKPDYVPEEYLSEKIADGLGEVREKRILLPRADIASKKLPSLLVQRGALVDEVVAYRTVIPGDLTPNRLKSILSEGVDLITFTSPSTVRNFTQAVGSAELERLLTNVKIACIGPVTVEAAEELGLRVDIVALNHTINGLVEAIENEIRTV